MAKINIKYISDDALSYIKANLDSFVTKMQQNDNNAWIQNVIKGNVYIEKKFSIEDFSLQINPKSADRTIDFENGVALYEHLSILPRYVLTDLRFWLWLALDKFYKESKSFIEIKNVNTFAYHWLDKESARRMLFFGVLSRLYFRVERTENEGDYTLTKWIFEKPERFRNLYWRSLSNGKNVCIGILKGCKKAIDELGTEEVSVYTDFAKYISFLGSATLLDAYSVEELSTIAYKKMLELNSNGNAK